MQDHWKDIERTYPNNITTWDEEQKEIFRQHQVDKVNACARKLIELGYFSSEQLENTLREFGVARGYFDQMYHLDWCYVWEKKASITWREFLFRFICDVDSANIFNNDIPGRLDDIHKVDYFCEEFKYNEQTHTVDHYHQQYRWKVAFKKKSSLNI